MKKIVIFASTLSVLIACTNGGEGNDQPADSVSKKDSVMEATGTATDGNRGDTASYERMPNKPPDSLKK